MGFRFSTKRSSLQWDLNPVFLRPIHSNKQMGMPTGTSESAQGLDILSEDMDLNRVRLPQSDTGHGHLKKMMMVMHPGLDGREAGHVLDSTKQM